MNRRNVVKALAAAALAAPLTVADASRAEPQLVDLQPCYPNGAEPSVTFRAHAREDFPREVLCAWVASYDLNPDCVTEVIVYGDQTLVAAVHKLNGQGRKYVEPGASHAATEWVEVRLTAPVPAELQRWYRARRDLAEQ